MCAGLAGGRTHDVLLSGDTRGATAAVAGQIGADEWIAEALPERKVAIIRELQQQGRVVAMIGDGVNDAPSLAQADLGIALGSGADIAMQAAPLVLMGRSLGAVIETLDLARRTFRIVRQNLFWAFAYNAGGHHARDGRNPQSDTRRGGDGALQPLGDRQFPPPEGVGGVKYTAGVSHLDRRQFIAAAVPAAIAAASETTRPYPEQLYDIYPVPPLARRNDAKRSLNFPENEKFFRFMRDGGVTRFVYGGNAFLYQITLAEYAELTHWLGGLTSQATIIPAVGPSFGRAIDQAPLIRRYKFPSVLVLPTGDPRDAAGLERGMREIAEACGIPLSLYVKRENDFGDDLRAGMDVIGTAGGFQGLRQYQIRRGAEGSRGRSVSHSTARACRPVAHHQRNRGASGDRASAQFRSDRIYDGLRRAGSQAVPRPAGCVLAEGLRTGGKGARRVPAAGRPSGRVGTATCDSRRGGAGRGCRDGTDPAVRLRVDRRAKGPFAAGGPGTVKTQRVIR